MTTDQEIFEQIEAYLRKTMTQKERQAFEQSMAKDLALRKEVELQANLFTGIEKEGLEETLEAIYQDKFGSTKIKKGRVLAFPGLKLAAGLALLIVAAWLIYQALNPTAADLFAKYYEAPSGLPTLLGTQNNPQFEEGMVAYKLGEYEKAGQIWDPLQVQMPGNDTLNFYLAANHMAQGKEKLAAQILAPIAINEKSPWQDAAQWYLALAYLKTGETTEAKNWLGKLADGENRYSERASKLLGKM